MGEQPYRIKDKAIDYRKMWFACFSSTAPCEIRYRDDDFMFNKSLHFDYIVQRHSPKFTEGGIFISDTFEDQYFRNSFVWDNLVKRLSWIGLENRLVQATNPLGLTGKFNKTKSFRVKVIEKPENNSFISIGLAGKPYPSFHHVGWDRYSIGIHSDDGRIYNQSHVLGKIGCKGYSRGQVVRVDLMPDWNVRFYVDGKKLDFEEKFECNAPFISICGSEGWVLELIR